MIFSKFHDFRDFSPKIVSSRISRFCARFRRVLGGLRLEDGSRAGLKGLVGYGEF